MRFNSNMIYPKLKNTVTDTALTFGARVARIPTDFEKITPE